jgi:aminopeptidase N
MLKSLHVMSVAVVVFGLCATSPAVALHHSINVSLFPPDNSLLAVDSISVAREAVEIGSIRFLINRRLAVENISSNLTITRWYTQEDVDTQLFKAQADSEDMGLVGRAKGVFVEFGNLQHEPAEVTLVIEYSGVICDSIEAPGKAYAKGFGTTTGLIEDRGVFLSNESLWYPFQFGSTFTFMLTVDVPYDWMSVSQGDRIDEYTSRIHDEDRVVTVWLENHATPELYLVAGKYHRHEDNHNGTWVMTYTYEQSDSLSQVYIDATKRYISMYENLIGPYPYGKFALVENFWQTGFGMPSFTLLGSKVIRLPFIVHTSYGHEILHNWWGNSVYVDYEGGNWCEGITTYGADYMYKEQVGEAEARDYRHHTLISFNNYVTPEKDFALCEFCERHDAASQSIGYGKALMVFHMLRKSLGDSLFWRGLREFYIARRFTTASWSDLSGAFGDVARRDLSWYFDQWVKRTGIPTIRLADADHMARDGRHTVAFTLEQASPTFVLDIPVSIETTHGSEDFTVRLRGTDSTYALETRAQPVSMAVDPHYDTFRTLYLEEIPLTLGAMFGQDSVVVVIGADEADSVKAALREMVRSWGVGGPILDEADLDREPADSRHLWLLGRGRLAEGILGLRSDQIRMETGQVVIADTEFSTSGNTFVCTLRNPSDETLGIGVVMTEDIDSLVALAPRLPHYARYSYIGFQGQRPVVKGVWKERRSPLKVEFKAR